ncbi:TIGR02996 domain-containing protein [Urbifossiella limnaea]|uniref:TIGR02996 domain-containing protein n=1 Tax=Urbifossiella limnaea TaxID=2528023 RepID=A0A517XSY7_9BACT|nr:TIGR02996 domain-containing protein [Urbifossiella limnaea]QDU20594.1 hypothetical protein ETAA1_25490 [Urbifossiella limnaea]
MTDETALLAAVVAAPDDETPRLVLADWWDDYNRPDRADFVRIECQLARLLAAHPHPYQLVARARSMLCISDREFRFEGNLDPALEEQDQELVRLRGWDWDGGVSSLVEYVGFRRGFVEEVGMSGRAFLRSANEMFARAPVRHVSFSRTPTALLPELTACPYLGRLRSASFAHKAIGPAGAAYLARCPHLCNLEELDLTHCRIGDGGLAAIAGSPRLTRLTALDLWNNDLSDAGADTLMSSPVLSRLAYVRLGVNRFSRESEGALRESFGSRADFRMPGDP